jgi:endonuclease G
MFGRFMSRRRLLVGAGTVLVAPHVSGDGVAQAQERAADDVPDDLVAEILYEDSEPTALRLGRALIKPYWFQQPEGERPSPNWPADNVSFDYAHVTSQRDVAEPFELTAAVLEQLMALNSFQRNAKLPKVLFGIRGCSLQGGADRTTWSQGHMVSAIRPNHVDPRCLIGVWDVEKGLLALFKGSTVPGVDLMQQQINGAMGCNLMPTGFHQYRVGPHRGERQPGAFRQQTPGWFHRTKQKLIYAANDPGNEWDDLDGNLPFDNIHAAMLSGRKSPPYYSSAGCQVVVGAYSGKVPTGAWAEFRKAAGLAHPPQMVNATDTKDDGRQFDYLLLTGKEAQLVAAGTGAAARTLRFGAKGDGVLELQEKLAALKEGSGVTKTGVFDRKTLGAVIRWQVEGKIAPTGIITADTAATLGLKWT